MLIEFAPPRQLRYIACLMRKLKLMVLAVTILLVAHPSVYSHTNLRDCVGKYPVNRRGDRFRNIFRTPLLKTKLRRLLGRDYYRRVTFNDHFTMGPISLVADHYVIIAMCDENGYTPLMFAANSGKLTVVKILLTKDAQVDAKDNDDSTPLMFAAQHGYDDVVKMLLFYRASPEAKGKHGLSAIGLAQQNNHLKTVRILRDSL